MDTIETNAGPVGEAGATASPDTPAEVDTQATSPESAVSDGATDQGVEQASGTLLAGKYRSPEELEKAYKELEGKLGTLGQKASVADIIQEKYGISPEQLRETIEAQERERQEREWRQNPAGAALREVQALKQQIALQAEEKELDQFLQKNPEYQPFRDKIFTLGLNLERDKSYEEIATEYFGQARAQGQKDAYQKIETKKMSQPTGTASVPKRQVTEDDLKNLSVAELEALLPKADISHRL